MPGPQQAQGGVPPYNPLLNQAMQQSGPPVATTLTHRIVDASMVAARLEDHLLGLAAHLGLEDPRVNTISGSVRMLDPGKAPSLSESVLALNGHLAQMEAILARILEFL